MTIPELLVWQWSDYPAKHQRRVNLLIHIVAVPLFMLGCAIVVVGLARLAWPPLVSGLVLMIVCVMLEGIGHRTEPERPAPFRGFTDFVRRFFLEQWVTFPRFVLSGQFFDNLAKH